MKERKWFCETYLNLNLVTLKITGESFYGFERNKRLKIVDNVFDNVFGFFENVLR